MAGRSEAEAKYPALYEMESSKNCTVAARINNGDHNWMWNSCLISVGLSSDLQSLHSDISSCRLGVGSDRWQYLLSGDGRFSVESLRDRIFNNRQQSSQTPPVKWCKVMPLKVLCFAWRASQGRIPSAMALNHRGINLPTTACSICIGFDEDADHLLIGCPFAKQIRSDIFEWCGIKDRDFHSTGDLLLFAASWGRCPKKRIRLLAICYGLIWSIWKSRNDRLFQGIVSPVCIGSIKSILFHWLKCRDKGDICNWVDWTATPLASL